MWVWIPTWLVAVLVSLSKTLNHNCFVLRMGRKAVGPVCCVMHVKEPRTLVVKEKGLDPVLLDSHLEHPAGRICARYKSSVLLLFVMILCFTKSCCMETFCNQFLVSLRRKHFRQNNFLGWLIREPTSHRVNCLIW